jgi:hypothetical protein
MRNLLCSIIFLFVATTLSAKDYVKYTDQNGFVFWLDDTSKIPPPLPMQYKYEDSNGISFWVDDERKIPPEFRNKITPGTKNIEKPKSFSEQVPAEKLHSSTKISIVDNTIIIPVIFRNKGRNVKARMILDTGASVTTMYSNLASKLLLNRNRLTKVRSINANGISSDSMLTLVDLIEVDDKILANSEVMVIPSHSTIGADGLLGNSFLRNFNFTIDYEQQLLRWN